MSSRQVDRRTLLRGVGGAAMLSAATAPVLTACGGNSTLGDSSASNLGVKLPTYVRFEGVKPDLPATDKGVMPGYLAYPATPETVLDEPPAKGGSVSALAIIYGSIPPAVDRNKYWQELNKRLGAELTINMVPAADYKNKVVTAVAGGDLPDLMLFTTERPPQFQSLLKTKFQDLTEFLSGDAIKKYPFLANIPTPSWKNGIFNGGIYGVPVPRAICGSITFIRDDLVREKGLQRQPTNLTEFRDLCKGLTDAKNNRWALGNPDEMMKFVEMIAGAPNTWREENGKFTFHLETEEAKTALNDMLTLFKDGVFHPDAVGAKTVQVKQWMKNGAIAITRDGYPAWSADVFAGIKNVQDYIGAITPPARDGGTGKHWAGNGAFGVVAVKKADKARVEELLNVMNWLAAPFGSAEYQFRKYGVAGVDHQLQGTDPVLTDTGTSELSLPVRYIADAPPVVYEPGNTALTKVEHAFQEQIVPLAIPDPSVGLFSDAHASKWTQLEQRNIDLLRDIFAGRKSMADFDAGIKEWRTAGGDTVRHEFEKSFADANG